MSQAKQLVRSYLCSRYPEELVDHALGAYVVAKQATMIDDWHKTESHLGLYCEAVIRICRHVVTGSHTEIGSPRFKVETEANACMQASFSRVEDEPFRIMIPVIIKAIYAVRNGRGVDHLSQIKPNHIDARLQTAQADWTLAELTRLATSHDFQRGQQVVDSIVERELPMIERINGAWKILDPRMGLDDTILLVKYHDDDAKQADLVKICRKSQPTISRAIDRLDEQAMLHKSGRTITITTVGRRRVESLPRLRAMAS